MKLICTRALLWASCVFLGYFPFAQEYIYIGDSTIANVPIIDAGAENHVKCTFRSEGEIHVYTPDVISGYSVNGKEYLSRSINYRGREGKVFLQVVTSGLGFKVFFLHSETEEFYFEHPNGELQRITNGNFKEVLVPYIPECLESQKRLNRMSGLGIWRLEQLFSCEASNSLSVGIGTSWGDFRFEGGAKSNVRFADFFEERGFEASFGLLLAYQIMDSHIDIVSGTNLVYRELTSNKVIASSLEGSVTRNYFGLNYQGVSVEIPVGVRLGPSIKNYKLWVDMQFLNEFNPWQGETITRRTLDNEPVSSSKGKILSRYRYGLGAGIGVSKKVQSAYKIDLFARYVTYAATKQPFGASGYRIGAGFYF